jgi:hypothetical protein
VQSIPKVALSSLIGALLCAFFGFVAFFLLAIFDGAQPTEAILYGVIVGFIGAFVGVFIGLAVGAGGFGVVGGGIAGALATLLVVALYVFAVGSYGRYEYFLRESTIIFVVLALPTVATGVLTALIVKRW